MDEVLLFDDGIIEINCVGCGEPMLLEAGDEMTILSNGTSIRPVHNGCENKLSALEFKASGKIH